MLNSSQSLIPFQKSNVRSLAIYVYTYIAGNKHTSEVKQDIASPFISTAFWVNGSFSL